MDNYLNKIIHGNSIEILKKLPKNSIDVVFADPPYNLQISKSLYRPDNSSVKGVMEDWDKFESLKHYNTFVT